MKYAPYLVMVRLWNILEIIPSKEHIPFRLPVDLAHKITSFWQCLLQVNKIIVLMITEKLATI